MSAYAALSPTTESTILARGARPLVVFRLGAQRFALDALYVRGARRNLSVTAVPLCPPEIAGIAWVHAAPVTVIDLRPYLGLPPRMDATTPSYVMAEFEDERLALAVDKIEDVVRVAPEECSPTPVTMDPAWRHMIKTVAEHSAGVIAVLDLASVLRNLRR